jgi:exodeoxyribonuclease VII large subunit
MMERNSKNIYSVGQINRYIKNMFAQDYMLRSVRVRGELSNVKYHGSGHIYFTLKDDTGCMNGVMFAGNRSGLGCVLKEGMQVIVNGNIDVYERDGKYQLYAKAIEEDGKGALYERFLAMKEQMEEMGMFAQVYKQPIPANAQCIGIVTAPTGAAVRDIIQIAKRRNPFVQLVLYPAIVQGKDAAASITAGIRALTAYGVDVMIVGRGGGSMEDLWAFNEPEVAQAIFDCPIPVISAVGHETDTTIADYVADLRAPTPSAAAELAVFEVRRLLDAMEVYKRKLDFVMDQNCRMMRMKRLGYQERLERLSPVRRVQDNRMRLTALEEHFSEAMEWKLVGVRHRMEILIEGYKAASPLNMLSHGYSYVENAEGKVVKAAEDVKEGDHLQIRLYKGQLETVVERIIK